MGVTWVSEVVTVIGQDEITSEVYIEKKTTEGRPAARSIFQSDVELNHSLTIQSFCVKIMVSETPSLVTLFKIVIVTCHHQ